MLRAKRGLHSHLGNRPHTKAGDSNDQRCAQAWDVGNISDGAEHRALTHTGLCGWRRRRRWGWRGSFFFCLPDLFPASVAVGLPEAVRDQIHPQAQEDQAVQPRRHHIRSYADAIEQLKALGHDDHPNVANLIGYSYRKLGDYKLSQVWYERALKADPNHVLTWQYYGLWQIEQGNRDQAQYHLSRIAAICGTDCEEYRSLAAALEKPPGTGLVY